MNRIHNHLSHHSRNLPPCQLTTTWSLVGDVVGDITLDADGGDVLLKDGGVSFGKLSNNSNQLSIYSGNVEALRLNGSATSALGTLAVTGNTTVGGTLAITGNTTIATAGTKHNLGIDCHLGVPSVQVPQWDHCKRLHQRRPVV